ncbi:hypothetical protein AB4391_01500 [Vibrio lentus]|uniref:Uncharacterized protein n=1 Tax=Vibrio lentus TaxID=136468 RepID=A0A2N7KP04_9VIBR|nr:hypothetical protein [Vibrio lentus]PMM78443.1 hypothetical protein BCT49_00070 [Vibrio lentus]
MKNRILGLTLALTMTPAMAEGVHNELTIPQPVADMSSYLLEIKEESRVVSTFHFVAIDGEKTNISSTKTIESEGGVLTQSGIELELSPRSKAADFMAVDFVYKKALEGIMNLQDEQQVIYALDTSISLSRGEVSCNNLSMSGEPVELCLTRH